MNGWRGRFRIYVSDFTNPRVWGIDSGDSFTEVRVREVYIMGVPVITRYRAGADNITDPKAWLEGFGRVRITDDCATVESSTEV
jgi:hypothetical protein